LENRINTGEKKMNTHTKMLPEHQIEDLTSCAHKVLLEANKPSGERNYATIAAYGTVLAEVVDKAMASAKNTETEMYYKSKEVDKVVAEKAD
jgi:hypothetical protein